MMQIVLLSPVALLRITFSYEVLQAFRKKRVGKKGHLALKLDMSKGYDRVGRPFIEIIMLQMGFARPWVDFLMNCVTFVFYFIIINEEMGLTFKPQRRLRQGDPLSPYDFFMDKPLLDNG